MGCVSIGNGVVTDRDGPLSEAQRQLWVIQQMVDRPEVYNMPVVMDVESEGRSTPSFGKRPSSPSSTGMNRCARSLWKKTAVP